jgi:hypothetical protein
MKYALLTGECLITLSGCGVVQQAQMNNAKKKLATEAMQCSQMVLAVERADCNTAAENSTVRSHANDGDLLDVFQAQRRVLAGQVDRGEITREQANLQLAELKSVLRQQEIDRANNAAAVNAARGAVGVQQMQLGCQMLRGCP